jgi:molecular chaperone GrpE (heat shock protein)
VSSWRNSTRLGGSRQWRGFAQQAGTQSEQEPGSSSTASSDAAGKPEAKAEDTDAGKEAKQSEDGKTADAEAEKAKAEEAAEAEAKAAAAEAEAEAAAAAAEEELSPVDRLRRDLEDFQGRSAAKKKEFLIALADFENTKKRFTKERESRRRKATVNFARRMVDVYTEFQDHPALQGVTEAAGEGSPCLALQEGVSLTRDLFTSALEKGNVEKIPIELGTPVVNARHEVIGSNPGDGSLPDGSIAEVAEAGWILDLRSSAPQVIHKAKVNTVGSE